MVNNSCPNFPPPVRGLILTENARGAPYDLTALKKWLRINREVLKAEKVDVRVSANGCHVLSELLNHASILDLRVSVRTDTSMDPKDLDQLAAMGLFDVFLCPPSLAAPNVDAWLQAGARCGLPVRMQLRAPFDAGQDMESAADRLSAAKSVNIVLSDPFEPPYSLVKASSQATVAMTEALTESLLRRDVEVNVRQIPFCLINEALWPVVSLWQQFYSDHQQYQQSSYELADQLFSLPPHRARKVLDIRMNQHTSPHNGIDNLVLPWILHRPAIYVRFWALHKLTRHLNFLRHRPAPLPETVTSAQAALEDLRAKQREQMGAVCAECRFQRICDHDTPILKKCLPNLQVKAIPGDPVIDPLAFSRQRTKYFDEIDAERATPGQRLAELAEEARRRVAYDAPDREITTEEYEIQDHMTHSMPGAIRWYSFANAELQSSVLAQLQPPFTIALMFGGGQAAHIGFSFGRHAKIVCPMVAQNHRLVLHVDAEGYYVLLRDGEVVVPSEFRDTHYVPRKLGGLLEPRISIWNIDGEIVTQTLLLWEGSPKATPRRNDIKYSVMIVSTRYSRRLQAALLSLAHQRNFDMTQVEVVIGYVPGIDATDDIIDSIARTWPMLRIVRSPFAERHARAKGFLINESLRLISGKWVILMDSDILLPPNFLEALDKVTDRAMFVAPDGRKMLSPDTTAQILLGEIRPWECYPSLLESPGEFRQRESDGIPIGYCQCAPRSVFEEIRYVEFDHFEGADWFFGKHVSDRYGKETRLDGVTVLHLDHGGSQWYGARKQM